MHIHRENLQAIRKKKKKDKEEKRRNRKSGTKKNARPTKAETQEMG